MRWSYSPLPMTIGPSFFSRFTRILSSAAVGIHEYSFPESTKSRRIIADLLRFTTFSTLQLVWKVPTLLVSLGKVALAIVLIKLPIDRLTTDVKQLRRACLVARRVLMCCFNRVPL